MNAWRACAFAAALAAASLFSPGTIAGDGIAPPVPDPAADPAGAWTHFLAHGEFAAAWTAYDVLPTLGYRWDNIDADACRKQADALQAALRKAPVGLTLHRAAMLCAEATGDEIGAERAMLAFAGLARHALQATADGMHAAPIRVLRQHDAYALVYALGMEDRYEWYGQATAARTFPIVIAAWDPDRKAERMLRFDWIDVAQQITRAPESQSPSNRDEIAQAQVRANARAQDGGAVDYLAWVEARALADPQAKLEKLRLGVGAGGVQSAYAWLAACHVDKAPADCGDGFVDAVLPLAEKHHALPLAQLAYAYLEGIGVPRDASVATRLLEAADQRWSRRGASAWLARTWAEFHDAPLPGHLVERLEHSVASGSDDARLALLEDRLRRDDKAPLTDADIAFLSSKPMNGAGQGFALLASIAGKRKQDDDAARFERMAAESGHPYMQGQRAWRLLYGEGKRDKAEGEHWLAEAAHGGNAWSARQLSWRAAAAGDALAAERWLLQPLRNGDVEAAFAIAGLFEAGLPGTTGDAKRAVAIYRDFADTHPEARRRLAALASLGKGMPQDLALARRLLLQDAENDDAQSQAQLGLALLNGRMGPVDEPEGMRWVERAIAAGEEGVAADYGYWLYYRKGTAASRTRALDVWRKASERGDASADNNLAWTLCTAPFDEVRNPGEGLAIVSKMGDTVDMPVNLLDTVAACHAANGNFAEARRAQAEAVAQIDAMRAKRAEARAKAVASDAPAQSAAARRVAKAKAEPDAAEAVAATDTATDTDAAEAAEAEDYRARLALYADGKAYRESADRHE